MISVIIPAKDASATLPACLAGVLCQTGYGLGKEYEVIVVDDGSHDNTAEIAASAGARVIRQANAGPASARNAGARAATGDILAFTDADCAPAPQWLTNLTAPFQDPRVVGVKGTYRTHQAEPVARFVQLEYESKYQRMQKLPAIDFIDTYSAAYRRSVFLENQGFDTSFPLPSVEDQEFSFRLSRKGYHLVFAPQATVYHLHDRSLGEYIHRKFNIGYWKAYMLRWLPEKTFADSHTLPSQRWQILLLAVAGMALLLSLAWPVLLAVCLLALVLFYATAAPFVAQVARRERSLLGYALVLLAARAGALGAGLAAGLLFASRAARTSARSGTKPIFTLGQRIVKRSMDIVLAGLGLLTFLPLVPLVMLAIKLDSPGPVFHCQERAGENGRPFKLYKFRTMVANAEKLLAQLINPDELPEPAFKLRQDPRVTRVGKFLRRWSLDEIPQLWNVLCGEMSLVGPRPEESWLVARYNDAQRQRLAVKPGLTGPMQISGRGALDFKTRLELELDYIQNYSLRKDFWIILKSIPAVINGKGAY
jgi:lipopolysaccharide/colanic/teichoic acid biosynthesis glycosyltransferase/glycosyltransferase involved in cell wall biosynthesis